MRVEYRTGDVLTGKCGEWEWVHTWQSGCEHSHVLSLLSLDGRCVKFTGKVAMVKSVNIECTVGEVTNSYGKYK